MVGDGGTGYSAQIMKAEVKVKTKLFLLIATVLMFAMGAIVGSIAQADEDITLRMQTMDICSSSPEKRYTFLLTSLPKCLSQEKRT